MEVKSLKIGILADSVVQTGFNGEVLDKILRSSNLEISALIVNNRPNKKKRFFSLFKKYSVFRIFEKFLFLLIFKFERFVCNFFTKTDFAKINLKKTEINVTPEITKKNVYTYKESDLKKIEELKLDVIIRMCSGILKGKILETSKFGVISYHHGDNDFYRGVPAGFWEVYNKDPITGFIIQKLNNELDNGEILFKGCFATASIFYLNNINVYKASAEYILNVLNKIQRNETFLNSKKSIYFKPLYKEPKFTEIINYIIKTYLRVLMKNFLKLFFKEENWKVAYIKGNVFQKRLENYKIVENKRNTFLADPFLWKYKNKNYLFVEEYIFKKNKGTISCYLLDEKETKYLGTVLEEDFHLSFPFIFEYNGKIYLCPETKKINEIRLYECVEFPLKWKFSMTLIKNVKAVDTLIFKKDSIWWLLTNSSFNDYTYSSELNIFYSKDGPLTSNWKPHKQNPIYVDRRISRNGGIIFDNEKIYRINQKFGFGEYGKEFNINLIEEINEENFIEKKIWNVKPDFFKNLKGTHHFNNNDDYCVIDFK